MSPRGKLDLEKIRAALNTICPHCSESIPPAKQKRIDMEHMVCPGCGQTFTPSRNKIR